MSGNDEAFTEGREPEPTLTRAQAEARLTDEVLRYAFLTASDSDARDILLSALFPEVPHG